MLFHDPAESAAYGAGLGPTPYRATIPSPYGGGGGGLTPYSGGGAYIEAGPYGGAADPYAAPRPQGIAGAKPLPPSAF
jgi:hypothetical protein